MADYDTEEEQIEAIKAWWKKNGSSIISGVLLGTLVVFGWKMYQSHQLEQSNEASLHYERALAATKLKQNDVVLDMTKILTTDYTDSNYAVLSSLLAAKVSVENENLDDAAKYLKWASDKAPEDLANIARIRLARVQIAQKKYQEALKTLDYNFSEQVLSDIEEVRGDAYFRLGQFKQAKQAYEKALISVNNGQRKTNIEMKMDDLAV